MKRVVPHLYNLWTLQGMGSLAGPPRTAPPSSVIFNSAPKLGDTASRAAPLILPG